MRDYPDEFYPSELDAAVNRIAGAVAESLSPLEAFDEICGGHLEIVISYGNSH